MVKKQTKTTKKKSTVAGAKKKPSLTKGSSTTSKKSKPSRSTSNSASKAEKNAKPVDWDGQGVKDVQNALLSMTREQLEELMERSKKALVPSSDVISPELRRLMRLNNL